MLENSDTNVRRLQPARSDKDNFDTVEELGRHAYRLAALLRAAIRADSREDEGWLVSMAHDEAEEAEACYAAWSAPAEEGA